MELLLQVQEQEDQAAAPAGELLLQLQSRREKEQEDLSAVTWSGTWSETLSAGTWLELQVQEEDLSAVTWSEDLSALVLLWALANRGWLSRLAVARPVGL